MGELDFPPLGELRYSCDSCPLRTRDVFRAFEPEELRFIKQFRRGEKTVRRGESILNEGDDSQHLYTVVTGWGFRYKLLPDGRRQILNFVMPGDLVGLQGTLTGEMEHSVEALSPMHLCVFDRGKIGELYRAHPGLAFDITWLASREEQMLDEALLSLGRRSSLERAAYLIAFIASRAKTVGLNGGKPVTIPITQQHIADTLGLSLVHTNKTIRRLMNMKLVAWREGGCEVLDVEGLAAAAKWEGLKEGARPLL